ncbi:MAG: sodium:solute symporter family protein [Victivallaceae bacterium]|nr:sodium:solute symporter family protein [Victivallaceae bacterium]
MNFFPSGLLGAASSGALGLTDSGRMMLYGGIIFYIFCILLIGWFASGKVKGLGDFLVAGRRLPLWMTSATLLATWFGAGSSMGVAATVYSSGLGAVIADPFAASFSLLFAGVFIVGMLRKLKCLTVTDIIERRYGKWAGIYASAWMVPVYVGWLGAQMLGLGTIMHVLTGMDRTWGTVLGAVVVLIYTVAGGMWAVTLTDVVQVALIVLGLFIIVPGAVQDAGGWNTLFARIPAESISLAPPAAGSFTDYVYYAGQWIVMGLGCAVGQDLIQRSLASKTEKVAVSSAMISGFFYVAIAMVPITIGFAARFVLAKHGVTEAAMGSDLENQVLPRMAIIVLGNLSPVLLTLFLSALISAIMSSADSSLLAGASLISNNIVKAIWPRVSDRNMLLLTRIITVLLTVIATFLALKVTSIYRLLVNSWASQLVIVFMPVIGALYFRKASSNCAWACMMVSTMVWMTYVFIGAIGIEMPFVEMLNSDQFDRILTCGAVYGFFAGMSAFLLTYWGERLPERMLEDLPGSEE